MLTDEQVDEIENLIYFAEPDQIMEVLSKLLPVLFAELRITRGTLDSKVNSFLNGVNDARDSANEGTNDAPKDGETAPNGGKLIHDQPHEHQADNQGSQPQPELPASVSDPATTDKPKKTRRRVSKPRRNSSKKARDTGCVDTRASKAKVGRDTSSKPKTASRKSSKPDVGIDDLPDLTGDD